MANKRGLHPTLNHYLDGLDALTDGRGFGASHERARLFVEGACQLAWQIARMSTYGEDADTEDAIATMNSLIAQAKALANMKPTGLHYFAAARDDGWAPGDEDSPKEYCRTADLSESEIMSANVADWREEYDWWKKQP